MTFISIQAQPALTVDWSDETDQIHICPTGDPSIMVSVPADQIARLINRIEIAVARRILAETRPQDIVRPTMVLVADNTREAQ